MKSHLVAWLLMAAVCLCAPCTMHRTAALRMRPSEDDNIAAYNAGADRSMSGASGALPSTLAPGSRPCHARARLRCARRRASERRIDGPSLPLWHAPCAVTAPTANTEVASAQRSAATLSRADQATARQMPPTMTIVHKSARQCVCCGCDSGSLTTKQAMSCG